MSYVIVIGILIFCFVKIFSKPKLRQSRNPSQPPPSETEKMLAYMEAAKYKTNHVLHLLLSLLTVGGWTIIWFIVAADNTDKRNRIYSKHGLNKEANIGPTLLGLFILLILAVVLHR
jgi:hypothetical protein